MEKRRPPTEDTKRDMVGLLRRETDIMIRKNTTERVGEEESMSETARRRLWKKIANCKGTNVCKEG